MPLDKRKTRADSEALTTPAVVSLSKNASLVGRYFCLSRSSPETLDKLEHEHSFGSELDATSAVRPLVSSRYDERTVLVLENLALFLDDLQWLDAATPDLLEDLLSRLDVHYLMLIGAYRNNEVNSGHVLMRWLVSRRA